MTKMICVKCRVRFQRQKSGVAAVEMFATPPSPYKVWHADLFECPGCHAQIVSDHAREPMGEHYQAGFAETLQWAEKVGRYEDYESLADVPREAHAST